MLATLTQNSYVVSGEIPHTCVCYRPSKIEEGDVSSRVKQISETAEDHARIVRPSL